MKDSFFSYSLRIFLLIFTSIVCFNSIACNNNNDKVPSQNKPLLSSDLPQNALKIINRWVIAEKGLRMRDKPGLTGSVMCLIPYSWRVTLITESSQTITLDGEKGKWTKVKWDGREGWVFGRFLSSRKPHYLHHFRKIINIRNEIPGSDEILKVKKFNDGYMLAYISAMNNDIRRLWLSEDYGNNWIKIYTVSLFRQYIEDFVITDSGYIIFANKSNQIMRSSDWGNSWEIIDFFNLPYKDAKIIKLFNSPNGEIFAILETSMDKPGQQNYRHCLYISRDNGSNWETLKLIFKPMSEEILFNSRGDVFVFGMAAVFYASIDYRKWKIDKSPTIINRKHVLFPYLAPYIARNDVIYIPQDNNKILISHDNGENYDIYDFLKNEELESVKFISDTENGLYAIVNNRKIFYSSDRGISWVEIPSPGKNLGSPVIDSTNTLYLRVNNKEVFKTTNRGKTWQRVIELEHSDYINWLVLNEIGQLIIIDFINPPPGPI